MATTSAISEVEAVSRGHSGDGPQLRGHPRRGSAASEASSEASLASSASSSAFLLAPSSQEVTDSAASGSSTSFVPSWVLSTLLLRIYTSSVFHRIYKWFKAVYGVFSGTSELQRICTPRPTLQFICITSTGKLAKDPLVTDVDPLNGHDSDTSNNGEDEVPPSLPLMRTGSNGHQHHRRVFLPAARTSHSTDSSKVPLLNSRSVPIAVIEISVGTVYRVDRAILYSSKLTAERRQLERADGNIDEAWRSILRCKHFPGHGELTSPPALVLRHCLKSIAASYSLMNELNTRAQTKYDSTVGSHERKLLKLWDILMPNEKLDARQSLQWQKIGFQGKDPATDFRSMGMLALDDLHYYAKNHTASALHVLKCSQDSDRWYSFAIVGINITSFAVQTLRTRRLQHYLYRYGTTRAVYHEYYSYLFHSFNEFWMKRSPPPTIMDFERVFADFRLCIETELLERRQVVLNENCTAIQEAKER